jgi:hypothetical protein
MQRRRPVAIKEQVAALVATFEAHAAEDTRRFGEVNIKLDGIGADVKTLLDSRQYTRGFWKAILLVGSAAGGIAGLVVAVVALWK